MFLKYNIISSPCKQHIYICGYEQAAGIHPYIYAYKHIHTYIHTVPILYHITHTFYTHACMNIHTYIHNYAFVSYEDMRAESWAATHWKR